ncbi:hypothetical protein [Arcicella lustrica]|uniref:Uncharacterized protein n=1 Tax=Arcicella lustrica TaxID=2984196 RepID=A0ABU5SR61_9BACT|nr:hypothetical protein [Arcicella sp. DC25W]MEA5429704.1 hypothetical protein [Arcicella sp. DC25W]
MKTWWTASLAVGFGGFFYGVVVQFEDIGRAGKNLLFLFFRAWAYFSFIVIPMF